MAKREIRFLLARWRSRNQTTELGQIDLQFTPVETHTFFTGQVEKLSDEEIEVIYQRLEGWPAGLQLMYVTSAGFNRTLIVNLMQQQLPECLPNPMLVTVVENETLPAKQAARKLAKTYEQAIGRVVPSVGYVWALHTCHPSKIED